MTGNNPTHNLYALNIDPSHSDGNPTAEELLGLGVQSVRFTFKDGSGGPEPDQNQVQFYQQTVQALSDVGISSLIILTNESLSGNPASSASDETWDNYITRFAARAGQLAGIFKAWQPAWQIWNEPDLLEPSSGYDPTLRQAVFGRMLKRCYEAIKAVAPNLKVVTAGLASGQPTWLQGVINSLGTNLPADAVAFHPYTKQAARDWPHVGWGTGYVGDLIDGYRQVTGLPLWISEIGHSTQDNKFQASYLRQFYETIANQYSGVVERMYWFCYSDGMVEVFGLLDKSKNKKEAYTAYRQVSKVPVTPPSVKTYAVEYVSHNTPATMLMDRTTPVQITLRNTGNWTWPDGGNHPVRLGYRWYDAQTGEVVAADLWPDLRTVLPFDLPPGQSVTLNANLGPPSAAGAFEVRWDVVEEMETWFSWKGVPTLNVPVEIKSSALPPAGLRVTASHNNTQTGQNNLLLAVDGNVATRWSTRTPQQPGMWFQIDLGEVKTISQVQLKSEASPLDYPRGYKVQTSTGGTTWQTVAEKPVNDAPVNVVFSPHQAQYVRIEQTGRSDQWWWSIHEVDIGTEVKPTVRASHNNVSTGADNLSNLFDGNLTTRWSTRSLQQPGMWLEIDLQEISLVRGLELNSSPSPEDYPRGYVIRVSADGVQWTEAARSDANTRSVNVNFGPYLARYLCVEQTGSSDSKWWSVHELEVKSESVDMFATASHHNVLSGGDNILQAFDGDPKTRWSSNALQQPGMWFEIDLNRIRPVSGLQLDTAESPQDYPRGYVVKVSQDRQQWAEVARNANNDRVLDINISARLVRYIRIEQTGSSDTFWWSIYGVIVR